MDRRLHVCRPGQRVALGIFVPNYAVVPVRAARDVHRSVAVDVVRDAAPRPVLGGRDDVLRKGFARAVILPARRLKCLLFWGGMVA